MYKILVLNAMYNNVKVWEFVKEDGIEFATDNVIELDARVDELLTAYSSNSIRVVYELDINITVSIDPVDII